MIRGHMENKIFKKFIYEGFGFPIVLTNVPAKKIRGEWIPFINYSELAKNVLRVLCFFREPLTGNQVFFIRQQIRLTGQLLADMLGVTQAAVSKWEKKGNAIAKIEPAIEFCLRFVALEYLEKGGSDALQNLFLKKHLLGDFKAKQKDIKFMPTPVSLKEPFAYAV